MIHRPKPKVKRIKGRVNNTSRGLRIRLNKLKSRTTKIRVVPRSKSMPDDVKAARSTPSAINAHRRKSVLKLLMLLFLFYRGRIGTLNDSV